MALYEGNFIRLLAVVPGLHALQGEHRSRSSRDLELHLSVEFVTRFTIDLRMTYIFNDPVGAEPDLRLRTYLDARMAEVIGWAPRQRHAALAAWSRSYSRPLDQRWSQNMVLSKWLDYLVDMGHAFAPA